MLSLSLHSPFVWIFDNEMCRAGNFGDLDARFFTFQRGGEGCRVRGWVVWLVLAVGGKRREESRWANSEEPRSDSVRFSRRENMAFLANNSCVRRGSGIVHGWALGYSGLS